MRLSPAAGQRIAVAAMWALALVTIGVLLFIITFVLVHGLPQITWTFLTESPQSMGRKGGVFPMIVGTIMVAGLAVAIAAPIGVATALYLTEYTRESRLTAVIRFGADCLAGIPSIIFGLFGFVFFTITLGMGLSVLSGALTLALMVLPTIIRTTEEAIRAVPHAYREVSYGLGSTRWQMATKVVLPLALPGICTGVVLSLGRSISETAAVMLTAGSALHMPNSLFDSSRTLALHFYILSREGLSMENAYATASVLIISILALNALAYWLMRQFVRRAGR
ncbi:MAG TPA: phosphate ABC transporter permease PstA [Candidatus Hydrogenedentes bacterium]|nr:phosphate ABC transporter permease PstA [Candidatus Hydrogenedentota bacterium]HQE82580.1 phosphate ABC transporter permease PstA [Candidatus Hydrogenedentota bacterium]HQH51758.1 phosphate ABC transporter permease PstA [Candidatus Hydrogenedentota bacterium]HQM47262.1 phosphate ABC transporter permease PstA [Candidatus Hydrogenedentota bacterium]